MMTKYINSFVKKSPFGDPDGKKSRITAANQIIDSEMLHRKQPEISFKPELLYKTNVSVN